MRLSYLFYTACYFNAYQIFLILIVIGMLAS